LCFYCETNRPRPWLTAPISVIQKLQPVSHEWGRRAEERGVSAVSVQAEFRIRQLLEQRKWVALVTA